MDEINYNKRRRFSEEALLRGPNSNSEAAAAALTSLVHSTLQNRGNGAFMGAGTLSGFSRRPTVTELPLLEQLKSLLQDPAVVARTPASGHDEHSLRQAAVDLMVAASHGQHGMGGASPTANPDQFPQTKALLRLLTGSQQGQVSAGSAGSTVAGTSYLTNELVRVQDFIHQASFPTSAPPNEVQNAITALMGLSASNNGRATSPNAASTSSLLASWQATLGGGNGGHPQTTIPAAASAPAPSGQDLQSLLSSSCGSGNNNSQALMDQYLQQLMAGAAGNTNAVTPRNSAMVIPPQDNNNSNHHLTEMVQKMLQQKQASSPSLAPSVAAVPSSNNTMLMDQISALLKQSSARSSAGAPASALTSATGTVANATTTTKRKFSEALAQAVSNTATAGMTGKASVSLYLPCDDERLSGYHALARKHIEFFEANHADTSSNARGRNRPIVLGQVGIRCKHCSHLTPRRRARAAMYYPFKLELLYQACQTLANVHLCEQCEHIPAEERAKLVQLKGERTTALVGKKYWADGARRNGVYESEDGLRFHQNTNNVELN